MLDPTAASVAAQAPGRRAVAVGIALVAIVGTAAVIVPKGPLPVDESWSDAMQAIQTPPLTKIADVFDALGSGLGVAVGIAIVAGVLAAARRWRALFVFLVAEAAAILSSTVLKALVGRSRPPNGHIDRATSFPSGHTTYAGVTCVALVLLFSSDGPRRKWWSVLAALGIAGMAWSRTYLQVHWLSDVIAGALLGIGVALVTFGAMRADGERAR
jgi:membrane-associated phospholipid phosphatase